MYAVPNIAIFCSSNDVSSEICNCLEYLVSFSNPLFSTPASLGIAMSMIWTFLRSVTIVLFQGVYLFGSGNPTRSWLPHFLIPSLPDVPMGFWSLASYTVVPWLTNALTYEQIDLWTVGKIYAVMLLQCICLWQ